MKSFLIAALFCIAITCAAAQIAQCPTTSCGEIGADCGTPVLLARNVSIQCKYGSQCNTNNKCVALIAAGAACDNSINCVAGYECRDSVCSIIRNSPGGPCSSNTQCKTTDNSGATIQGTCTNTKCVVIAIGQTCQTDSQCGFEFGVAYCTNNTCTALLAAGASCTDANSVYCSESNLCLDGVCRARESIASGANCQSTNNCQAGLVCGNSGTCTAARSSSSLRVCTSPSDCDNNEDCSCGTALTATHVCVAKEANRAGQIAANDAITACTRTVYECSVGLDSCTQCDSAYCNFLGIVGNGFVDTCSYGPHLSQLPQQCKSNAATGAVLSIAVVVAAIAALL